MKFLKNKLAVTIIVLSVTFLGLIILTFSKENKGLEASAGSALNPFQRIVYSVNQGAKDFVDFFLNFSTVKDQNKELTQENGQLKDQLTQYSDLESENQRLKGLLDFKDSKDNYNYITTSIIHYSGGSILDGFVVDKGSDDGVQKGMVVVAAEGLVGQVSSVGSNWAIIQSIMNENIAVSVMTESTRENTGILMGDKNSSNDNLVNIEYLPIDSQIKEGDVILTSGLGLVYPKEIRIGVVESISEDKVKVMKSAKVKPYVDFNKLEELMIIVPKDTREIKYN